MGYIFQFFSAFTAAILEAYLLVCSVFVCFEMTIFVSVVKVWLYRPDELIFQHNIWCLGKLKVFLKSLYFDSNDRLKVFLRWNTLQGVILEDRVDGFLSLALFDNLAHLLANSQEGRVDVVNSFELGHRFHFALRL